MYMESQNMRIDAVYTLEDGQIVTTYMLSGQEGTMEEAYYFDGDTLVISGIGYQKEWRSGFYCIFIQPYLCLDAFLPAETIAFW